jgi:RimJ/RimL family protein N-acetyltransferase
MGVRYMIATTAVGFEAAERWIARLGFIDTGEVQDNKKVHAWFAP